VSFARLFANLSGAHSLIVFAVEAGQVTGKPHDCSRRSYL